MIYHLKLALSKQLQSAIQQEVNMKTLSFVFALTVLAIPSFALANCGDFCSEHCARSHPNNPPAEGNCYGGCVAGCESVSIS